MRRSIWAATKQVHPAEVQVVAASAASDLPVWGRGMGRGLVFALVLLVGPLAFAERVAQGKLLVSVRVVDAAKVEMAEVPQAAQARPLKRAGATEWTVPMRARL